MNIQEYKARKDKLREDLFYLINEFNDDVDTVIVELDIDINTLKDIGRKGVMLEFKCKIKTEIDE